MITSFSETYKPTSLYRSLVSNKTITPTSRNEEAKYVPNHTTVGNTWDARHMDKFLATHEWGQNSPTNTVKSSRLASELSPIRSPRSNGFSSPKKSPNSTKKMGESFFVRNEPRDAHVPLKEYLHKIYKDFAALDAKSDINTMVLLSGNDAHVLDRHYTGAHTPHGKRFDPTKLEFSKIDDNGFMSPKQRRQEIDEIKANQVEFEKWSGKIKQLTKMQRVYKNAFRSGILGLDNPINPDTVLYKEENDKYTAKRNASENIDRMRRENLANRTGTNPALEFLNREFKQEAIQPPQQIVSKNAKKHVNLPHVDNWRDSRNRLFGDVTEKVSESRKNYLIEKDTRGRNWDLISGRIDTNTVVKGC